MSSGGSDQRDLGPLLLASAVAIAVLHRGSLPVVSNDFHIFAAMGRWMVDHGTFLEREVFTWTAPDTPFQHATWGFSLAAFGLHEAIGLTGLRLLNGLFVGAAVLVAGVATWARGTGWRAASFAALYAWLGVLQNGVVRGQTWVFVLFAGVMWVSARRRHTLVWGLVLGALWAPLHGSFPAGIAWALLQGQPLLAAGLALGACLGPYGPAIWTFVLDNTSDPMARGFTEWLPPTLDEPEGLRFWVAVGAWVAVLAWRRKMALGDLLVLVAFGALAARSTRFVAWFALATAPVLGTTIRSIIGAERGLPRRIVRPLTLGLGVTWVVLLGRGLSGTERQLDPETPVALVAAIAADASGGRVLNPPEWGGYLTFELGEAWLTSGDIRAWVFSDAAWAVWIDTATARPGWQARLDDAEVTHVLLTGVVPTSSLGPALDAHDGWVQLASDATGSVWRRKGRDGSSSESDTR
jgi:hypothetical protein